MTFLSQQYRLLQSFLRGALKKYILISTAVLILSLILGGVVCLTTPQFGDEVMTAFQTLIEEGGVVADDGSMRPLAILSNNWSAMMSIALYGIIPFCYFPAVTVASNGMLVGVLLAYYYNKDLPVAAAVLGIIPHGIFELPALVLAGAAGICFCREVTRRFLRRDGSVPCADALEDLLRVLLLVVFPLILIAAVVECYITPGVISMFF